MTVHTYWRGNINALETFLADWRRIGVEVRIHGPNEVAFYLEDLGSNVGSLFLRIRLPACQSDLARLIICYKFGGLFVDAHAGEPNLGGLMLTFARLESFELVTFLVCPGPPGTTYHLANGAICARAGSNLIRQCLDTVIDNLRIHETKEISSDGHVPYNIVAISGSWVMRMLWFDTDLADLQLREDLRGRLSLILEYDELPPFKFYRHYEYRKPGQHWSERQLVEPLFDRLCGGA